MFNIVQLITRRKQILKEMEKNNTLDFIILFRELQWVDECIERKCYVKLKDNEDVKYLTRLQLNCPPNYKRFWKKLVSESERIIWNNESETLNIYFQYFDEDEEEAYENDSIALLNNL